MSIFSHLKQSPFFMEIFGQNVIFLTLHLIHSSRRVYWELLNSTNHYHFEKTIALIPT